MMKKKYVNKILPFIYLFFLTAYSMSVIEVELRPAVTVWENLHLS